MTLTISQAERNPKIPITTPHGTRKSPNLNSAVRRRVKKSIPGSLFHFFRLEASAADQPQVGIYDGLLWKSLDTMSDHFLGGTA
jgi:hypothetical protein